MSTRITRAQMLLDVAATIARRSTCNRLAVGAVVALSGRILTTGYNGPPAGMPHCDHEMIEIRSPSNPYPITKYPADGPNGCQASVHAEANAIAFAARHGVGTDCAELYVTHSPCVACAKLIINAGIVKVIYRIEYRDPAGTDLLEQANVECYCAG